MLTRWANPSGLDPKHFGAQVPKLGVKVLDPWYMGGEGGEGGEGGRGEGGKGKGGGGRTR